MNLDEQLAAFDRHAPMVRVLVGQMLASYWDTICMEARLRLNEGYPVFGDGSWSKDPDVLWQEALEEAADLVNYLVMIYEQRED